MRKKRANQFRGGVTLIEVMLALAVVVIAALGSLCYEYLCVDHVRYARAEMTATRIAQLLIEDWKSTGGADDYDPQDLNMGFTLPPEVGMGNFMTVVDGIPLYISMDQGEVEKDTFAGIKLNRITVAVKWRKDFTSGPVTDSDPSITFNTYVRRDQ
jgi:prepilin-type N-terminal cleavage/methylation domain-containing protein